MRQLTKFLRDENGPASVEYAVLVALIAVVCLGGLRILGPAMQVWFDRMAYNLQ